MGSFSILQGPEDEAALLETITEAVIESAESLFLNPGSGNDQRSLQLKNIAINWLFLFAKASLRYFAYSYWLLKLVAFG